MMMKYLFAISVGLGFSSVLGLVACSGSDVPVGFANGGASGSAGASSTNGGAGASSISAGSGGAPQTPREQAATYARSDIACTVDSDCCVVVDNCLDTGYLVAATDRDQVRALLDGASMDRCLACIPPSVQIACEASRCVAKIVSNDDPKTPPPDELRQDHCGSLDTNAPMSPVGSEFGCGVGVH
jgi:hypothetical protein